MNKNIRFGIIGAGGIARKFAIGLQHAKGAELVAIASRSLDSANEFGDQFNIKKRYGSYEEMVADPEIDAVYISTPNALHKDHAILCLKNKKAVICEKPFGANQAHVEEMIQVARENKVFLMEAMWTRYFPVVQEVQRWVEEGKIGKVRMIEGDFGFASDHGYGDIRFSKDLAGGSMMDVGIYPVSFASMIYKEQPQGIKASAHIGPTGVDEQAAVIFDYKNGAMALLSSALTVETPHNMYIIGEKGYIHIPNVWYAEQATLKVHGAKEEKIHIPMEGNGYNYEAEELVRCLKNGLLESERMPLDESLEIIKTMDEIRKQWA